jgi:glycosyltransferase involved in cell wall biosynthesis
VSTPTAVFGLPLYNQTGHLAEALESLLAQSCPSFCVVVVDDSTVDEPARIVERYARHDSRIRYQRNAQRLGMVDNWRRAFHAAREIFPSATYFAWASDHDLWHPEWLSTMLEAMHDQPEVVAAFPLATYLQTEGARRRLDPTPDTAGMFDRVARMRRVSVSVSAGNLVYGLFRIWALERAGVFRHVLLPDRLLLAELSLYGQVKQVPQYLWIRRRTADFSEARQRDTLFVGRKPLYVYLPWPVVHAAVMANELVLNGRGAPDISRREGLSIATHYLIIGVFRQIRRVLRLIRMWASRRFNPDRYTRSSAPVLVRAVWAARTLMRLARARVARDGAEHGQSPIVELEGQIS